MAQRTSSLALALLLALLLLLLLCGCSGCSEEVPDEPADAAAPLANVVAADGTRMQSVVKFVDALSQCDVHHRGLLLDMGGNAMLGRYGWDTVMRSAIVTTQHDGATWARVYERKVSLNFYVHEVGKVFVALRAIGNDARRVTVALDGHSLGVLKLAKDETRIVRTRLSHAPLDPGLHTVQLRFRGRKTSDSEPFAEIDWLRVGKPDDIERVFAAPTFTDILVPTAHLDNVPHRAFAMRAPATVSCAVRVPKGGRFKSAIGMRGTGNGRAAIVIRRDGHDPITLERVDLAGGDDASWTDIELPLDDFAGQIVAIEMVTEKSSETARLMFGDPELLVPAAPAPTTPKAKSAVLLVLNGVSTNDLPPWRGTETLHLPALSELARDGTVFDDHRAVSTLVAASYASLLSGVSPRTHALADSGARLSPNVVTLGGVARDASVRASMFTGVPMTFKPMGFEEQWESFNQYPPTGEPLASAPIDEARQWIGESEAKGAQQRPLLAVVHARGGHPPWDITPKDAQQLPPSDYAGVLRPRDAATTLMRVRKRALRFNEADRERLRALYLAGLASQDAAIAKFVQALKDANRWDSTLFIVTGDVASARRTLFMDALPLDEELLKLPLYVHFPGGAFAGMRVDRPTDLYDVTHTVQQALSLTPRPQMLGHDLASIAAGGQRDDQRVRVAILDGEYSARWGNQLIVGAIGKSPRLCDLLRDPTCAFDRGGLSPLTKQALFRRLVAFTVREGKPIERVPVTIDSDYAAMLKVWGTY